MKGLIIGKTGKKNEQWLNNGMVSEMYFVIDL